jgi:hypothetical protein
LAGDDDHRSYRVVRGRQKCSHAKDIDLGTALVDIEDGELRAVVTTSPDVVAAQGDDWLLEPVGLQRELGPYGEHRNSVPASDRCGGWGTGHRPVRRPAVEGSLVRFALV